MTPMRTAVIAVTLALSGVTVLAQDWPQFRGPTGQGQSSERGLPLVWSETRNVAWKMPVPGAGWSSPVVAGGRVWLTTALKEKDTSLRLIAFDAATGRELVNVEVFRGRAGAINPKNSHASPTPIVDGDRVYVHFGAQGTAALSTAGELLWKTRFEYASQHGSGGSPVLHGGLLILSCDGPEASFVVALDRQDGKVRWRTWRRQPWDQAYTTPLVIRTGNRDLLVSVGAFRTTAFDPMTGKEVWRVSYGEGFSNVPRPVFGHGLLYIATGFDATPHVAWTLTRGAPLTPSPLLVGDELFVVNDGGIASCVDARTGAVHWQHRLGGNFSASPVLADGRIYFLDEDGVTTVIAAGATLQVLGSNRLDGGTLASMAVAQGAFFIRTATHLYKIAS
jgi:outer membrane protein assembly factor BamB